MDRVVDNIKQYASDKAVVLAISGGIDSMCMLSLFLGVRDIFKQLSVVTIEHGLRGQVSIDDALWVQAYCKEQNIECIARQVNIPLLAKQNKQSIELCAREFRRSVFKELLSNADIVALAHHGDDQIETILHRVFRGTGIAGLVGMQVLAHVDNMQNKYLFRPLLATNRQSIVEFVLKNNIPYREDSTNSDTDYARNYLRHNIIPLLKDKYNLSQTIPRLASNALNTDNYIKTTIDYNQIFITTNSTKIPKSMLKDSITAYQCIKYVFLNSFGNIDISSSIVNSVLNIAVCHTGKYSILIGDIMAISRCGYVELVKKDKSNCNSIQSLLLDVLEAGYYEQGNIKLKMCLCAKTVALDIIKNNQSNQAIIEPKLDFYDVVDGQDLLKKQLVLDKDKLPCDCVVRSRQLGDEFCPYGGKKRTLKKYLIERKIPRNLRDSLLLIAQGQNIMCICGVEIADCVKVDKKTKQFLCITPMN